LRNCSENDKASFAAQLNRCLPFAKGSAYTSIGGNPETVAAFG
jgi:hypothetical protein